MKYLQNLVLPYEARIFLPSKTNLSSARMARLASSGFEKVICAA